MALRFAGYSHARQTTEGNMILVTGASGNVGTAVVGCLRARGIAFRIGARRSDPTVSHDGAEATRLDFVDPSTFRAAVRGCNAVFLLRPPAVSNTRRTLNPFLDVAREEGVGHVVFISVAGAGDNPLVPHHAVEQHLRRGPAGWTILRPGFFAQNFGDAYRDDIVNDSRIFVPAGAGRVAFVDVRDVAEVAVEALVDSAPHRGRTYTLTGPEPLSFADAARIISLEIKQTIRYQPASVAAYFLHLRRRGMPLGQVIVQAILHAGLRFGQAETVDETLANLLGRPPRTLREYVRDHRDLWA